nr:DUF2812 domain-containing protein [Mobilitalea sibirica]
MAWEYDRDEAYINSMAEKGWQLIKGGLFHHTYKKSDEIYRYKLDFNAKINFEIDSGRRYSISEFIYYVKGIGNKAVFRFLSLNKILK